MDYLEKCGVYARKAVSYRPSCDKYGHRKMAKDAYAGKEIIALQREACSLGPAHERWCTPALHLHARENGRSGNLMPGILGRVRATKYPDERSLSVFTSRNLVSNFCDLIILSPSFLVLRAVLYLRINKLQRFNYSISFCLFWYTEKKRKTTRTAKIITQTKIRIKSQAGITYMLFYHKHI